MSVGFIGAGQLTHALVRGFAAAGEPTGTPRCWLQDLTSRVNTVASCVNLLISDCTRCVVLCCVVLCCVVLCCVVCDVTFTYSQRCHRHAQNHGQLPGHRPPHRTGAQGKQYTFIYVNTVANVSMIHFTCIFLFYYFYVFVIFEQPLTQEFPPGLIKFCLVLSYLILSYCIFNGIYTTTVCLNNLFPSCIPQELSCTFSWLESICICGNVH